MNLRSLEYAFAESVQGIRQNVLMSVAAVTTIALTLSILGGFLLVALGVNSLAQDQLDKVEISIWLDTEKTADDIGNLETKLKSLSFIKSVQFISSEKRWEDIKNNPNIPSEGIDQNSVLKKFDSFRIKLKEARDVSSSMEILRGLPHVADVVEPHSVIEQLIQFANMVQLIGGVSAIILFFIAVFIGSNTIRLTVYARRREIYIMQLVGATSWFIRMPFLFEGMILGTIGGVIACLIIYGSSCYIVNLALSIMPLMEQLSCDINPYKFYSGLIGIGIVLGAFSSIVSIRRYLKV